MTQVAASISAAILAARGRDGIALLPYLTAGFPTLDALAGQVRSLTRAGAAVIEIGIPFSDPMADGVTIQRSSHAALNSGATPAAILDILSTIPSSDRAPLVVMTYLNPLLSLANGDGPSLGTRLSRAGVAAIIVPDLPLEESGPLRAHLHESTVGLIQMVTPLTTPPRLSQLAAVSDGFLYAVTTTGVTGGSVRTDDGRRARLYESLRAARECSPVPVCAGFGIRTKSDVATLVGHADGAIIGSALVEAIARGEDAGAALRRLSPR